MNLSKYYSLKIIEPLEKEIKFLKKRINKKINLTRDIDKKCLLNLQNILLNHYKIFYKIKKIENM